MEILKKLVKKIFCRHIYKSIYWTQEINNENRYSIHRIKCINCEKIRIVDGDAWHFEIKNKYN